MTSYNHGPTTSSPEIGLGGIDVRIFSACPRSAPVGQTYLERVGDVARWSEAHDLQGLFVDGQAGRIDPWLLTETIVERTRRLTPLVSVQPFDINAYALATTIAAFTTRHARKVCIHWVTPSDDRGRRGARGGRPGRYEQLVEYAGTVRRLLEGEPVTYVGRRVGIGAVKLDSELPPDLRPEYMVSGACLEGLEAARALGALPVMHARSPRAADAAKGSKGTAALKLGIIARSDRDAAWHAALDRFPPRRGRPLTLSVSRKVSDSHWHLKLCRMAEERAASGDPYWADASSAHETVCPYLVGSYEDVASALMAYVRRGHGTFLLDGLDDRAEIEHASAAFELATGQAVAA